MHNAGDKPQPTKPTWERFFMIPRSMGSSVKKLTPGNNPNTVTAIPNAISRTAEALKPGPMSVMFPNRLIGSSSRMFCSSCKTLTDDYSQIFSQVLGNSVLVNLNQAAHKPRCTKLEALFGTHCGLQAERGS